MDTQSRIDRLLRRLRDNGLDTPTSTLYAEGLKAKLRQALFCLQTLRTIEHLEDKSGVQDGATGPAMPELLMVSEQVDLYCDSFWDFLRSALDILGQLINELRSLEMDERSVDFKTVANKVEDTASGSLLEKAIDNCIRSQAFKELENYRNCSRHRRPVYIETVTQIRSITGTPGYYFGGSVKQTIVNRYLCTNPLDIVPNVGRRKRPVVQYCESLLGKIERHIDSMLNRLL